MGQLRAGAVDGSQLESWSSRFVAGDETVLGELLVAWAPQMVRGLVRKYRGIFAEDQLEQIVLDALFTGWTKRQQFGLGKSSLVTWLDRIARHLVADRAKSSCWKQRCRETELVDFMDDGLAGRDLQAFDSGEDEDDPKSFQSPEMTGLLKALAELTPREHDALLASTYEMISTQNLARQLGISESTIRTYRQRAREKVLRKLGRAGFRVLEEGNKRGR